MDPGTQLLQLPSRKNIHRSQSRDTQELPNLSPPSLPAIPQPATSCLSFSLFSNFLTEFCLHSIVSSREHSNNSKPIFQPKSSPATKERWQNMFGEDGEQELGEK